MSIPKKGTRLLQVDDISYRCQIKSRDSYSGRFQGFSADTLRITIQQDVDRPGRVLQIEVISKIRKEDPEEAQHCGDYLKASLKPSDLHKIIKTGLLQGWDPLEKGAAFQVMGNLDLGDYCRIAKDESSQ